MMKTEKINFKNCLFLAPMAGVSDVGFRALAKFFGADLTWTEMVSAKGLFYGNKKKLKTPLNIDFVKENPEASLNKTSWLLFSEKIENYKGVQIFGKESEFMAKACENKLLNKFDFIDINMGCPAPKIIKNGEGSALMDNIFQAKQIIKACVKSTTKPITVKFRKGYKTNNAVDFAKMCQEAGASAITVHPRLMSQGYSGIADYSVITDVKKAVDIPVIGSGDVKDIKSYQEMKKAGADSVMIGRASLGNQVIFKQIKDEINGERIPLHIFVQKGDFFKDILTEEDIKMLAQNEEYIKYLSAKKHLSILKKYYSEKYLIGYMRKHMLWYASGLKLKTETKQRLALSNNLDDSLNILKSAF